MRIHKDGTCWYQGVVYISFRAALLALWPKKITAHRADEEEG